MSNAENQKESIHNKLKKVNKSVLVGAAATILIGGTAFGVSRMNHDGGESPKYKTENVKGKNTSEESATSTENSSSQKSASKKESIEEQTKKSPSIFEHFGITQPEIFKESTKVSESKIKPEELSLVASVLKNSIMKEDTEKDSTPILVQKPSTEEPIVTLPVIVGPTESGNQPTEPETPSIEEPALSWVGPKVYSLPQSTVVQQNSVFHASDYYFVSPGSQETPVISVSTIDTSIVGSQTLVITATDDQGYSDTLTIPIYVNSRPILSVSSDEVTIQIGSTVDLSSFAAASDFEEGDLTSRVTYTTDLNTSEEGIYSVNYRVEDNNEATATASLKIRVENEAPALSNIDMTVPVFSEFDSESYLSQILLTDREDKNIKLTFNQEELDLVDTTIPGIYEISLTATDSYGKSTTVIGKITVENSAPKLIGVANKTIYQGEHFNPLEGLSVNDSEEELSIDDIVVTGEYDISTPGEYTITLSISDSFGETTESFVLTVLAVEDEQVPTEPDGESVTEENQLSEASEL